MHQNIKNFSDVKIANRSSGFKHSIELTVKGIMTVFRPSGRPDIPNMSRIDAEEPTSVRLTPSGRLPCGIDIRIENEHDHEPTSTTLYNVVVDGIDISRELGLPTVITGGYRFAVDDFYAWHRRMNDAGWIA